MTITRAQGIGVAFTALVLLVLVAWPLVFSFNRAMQVRSQIARDQQSSDKDVQLSADDWLIIVPSHGAAGANLQSALRATARNNDMSLTRVEVQSEDADAPELVRATAQANGSLQAIAGFIHALETQKPYLILERTRIGQDRNGSYSLDLVIVARTAKAGAS